MAAKTYIGAKVRLLRDVTTRGGVTFRKGVVMKVTESNRGGLHLSCFVRGWRMDVSAISKDDVVVLEWPKKEDEDQ